MSGQVTLSDTFLIAAKSQSGEQMDSAVEQIVRDRAGFVYQITFSVLRNHHDAEDATQEVFLRVLRFKSKLADVRDVKTWIARIAWRVSVERSKQLRRKLAAISLDDENFSQIREALRDATSDALQAAAQQQMQAMLERLIPTLPEELRAPLVLSTVRELNSTEIAEILGTPEATVRTRLMRARKILKEKVSAILEKRA